MNRILALTLLLAPACKPAASSNAEGLDAPQRVGAAGDATGVHKVGVLGAGGGTKITLDLQRLPPPGSPNIFSCWTMPAPKFALGRAFCKADQTRTLEIVAANVEFTCSTSPDFGVVKAKVPLSTVFCDSYDIFAYEFNPKFEISVGN